MVKLARKEVVILRPKGKISFALFRLDEGDLEALALSQNSDFMAMLDKAQARYEATGGLPLEEVKRRYRKPRNKAAARIKKLKPNVQF